MQVNGETTIFRNVHNGSNGTWYSYATTISKKRDDGSLARTYLDVRFRKGVTVENKARINIKDGFLTLREYTQNGEDKTRLELMVLDFEEAQGNVTGFTALRDDEVPF